MKTIEQYEEIISDLSRQLAAERLRADTAWQRYENANMGQKLAREELAKLNAEILIDYETVARKAGYVIFPAQGDSFYWCNTSSVYKAAGNYKSAKEAWKKCCEDNGLLGDK